MKDFQQNSPISPLRQTDGANRRTLRHTDLLAVLALELVLLEGALPLLDVGFLLVLVQVQDEEAELALEHVLLPLGQLLLALPQELLVGLLLQRGSLQLLLTATQLLVRGGKRRGKVIGILFGALPVSDRTVSRCRHS